MVNIFVPAQTVIVAIKIFSHRLHLFCKKKKSFMTGQKLFIMTLFVNL